MDVSVCCRVVGFSVDWIDLAHDTDKWRAVLNKIMNFQVH